MRTGVYTFTSSIYALELYWETVCGSNEQLLLHMPMQHSSKLQDPNIPINVNHHNSFLLCNTTAAENKSAPKDTVGSLSCLQRLRRNPASLRVVVPVQRPRRPFTTSLPIRLWLSYAEIWGIIYELYNLWHDPRCFLQKVCWQKSFFGKAGAGSNHPGNSNCCMDAQIQ